MKRIFFTTLVFLSIMSLAYLMASFYYLTFNPTKWDAMCRYLVAVSGGCAASILSVTYYATYSND